MKKFTILFLSLLFLTQCKEEMINPYVFGGATADTTADGKQVVWVVGDSFTVRRPTGSYGPDPGADIVFQWDVADGDLYNVRGTDILQSGAAVNEGSIWPNWGAVYYEKTGKHPVLVTSGVGGTNYAPRTGETDNWSTSSTLYADSKADLDACLAYLGLERPKYIVVICGVNDARGATALSTVETEIQAFYSKVQTDYPDTEILMYMPGRTEVGVTPQRLAAVRTYLRDIVVNNTNCHMVGTFAHYWQNGYYLGDDLHLNQSGNNEAGEMFGRWYDNSAYAKIPRTIIASHFEALTTGRKDQIADWITDLGADYYDLDFFYNHKTTNQYDEYLDYSLIWGGYKTSTGFTTNSYITTNGTSSFWRPAFKMTDANFATQTDIFVGTKIATNRSSTAALRVALGGGDTNGGLAIGQLSGGNLYYRVNDLTNSTYTLDVGLQNDSFYVAARDSGNKYLYKNGSQVATAVVASSGVSDDAIYEGCNNNNGTAGAYIDADFEYCVGGKFTTVDQSNLYTACEALIDGW